MKTVQLAKPHTSKLQKAGRIVLGIFMVLAGIGHLTFQRKEFQAQVPNWVPIDKDATVLLSGVAEIMLGLALIAYAKQRAKVGIMLALFFIAVFPGNVAQYLNHRDAFGLNTDRARLARLFFQPVLIIWALWSSGALTYIRDKRNQID
ncbi:DoxX family protein [Pedobacter sp.]